MERPLELRPVPLGEPVSSLDELARALRCLPGVGPKAAQQRHQHQPYHVAMSQAGWACLEGEPVIEFMEPAK